MAEALTRVHSNDASPDAEMEDPDYEMYQDAVVKHFTVAIDFGTTFTSVSFIALDSTETKKHIHPNQIFSVEQYPYAPSTYYEQRKEVPTESWYPRIASRHNIRNYERADNSSPSTPNGSSKDDSDGDEQATPEDSGHPDAIPNLLGLPESEEVDDEDSMEYFWGYAVQKQLQFPDTNRAKTRRIARSKLLLDESPQTETIRALLRPILEHLSRLNIIKKETAVTDVIADFLEQLFRHTKAQLIKSHGFHDACTIEFVLCVPAIWTQKACRKMQTAMASAISRSGFGKVDDNSVDNLFIVSEPEAAAACVIADGNHRVKPGDTFVLLDAGGGTVDAITYTVDKAYPLRLKTEAVKPGGALCGSSYLNEAFERLLTERLAGEDYLETNNLTIKGIVDMQVVEFENKTKRSMDVTNRNRDSEPIWIQGLRQNHQKGFKPNRLMLTREDIDSIFMPCLAEVARLMIEQITLARNKDLVVKKVILIGGFAASPSLSKYLVSTLTQVSKSQGRQIQLLCPKVPGTAVAHGAVLRALRKEDGPARIVQSSYGFLRIEPHEPEIREAHRNVRPWYDKVDGQKYVKDTIDWLIRKDTELPPFYEFPIEVFHTFAAVSKQNFVCKEVLYVSDHSYESHYKKDHPKNQGADIAGSIVVDMTFLRKRGLIQPEGPPGKKYYKVEFKLVMIVDGRNLRYEARWPIGEGAQVQGRGQTCIAAAFVPGTK